MMYPYSPDVLRLNPSLGGGNSSIISNSSTVKKNLTVAPTSWREFESNVIKWLKDNGWRVSHSRPGRVMRKGKETWETPLSGDKGFPDILAIKGKHCIVIEVKFGSGKASPEEVDWLLAFQFSGIPTFLVTPENWQQTIIRVEEILESPQAGQAEG